MEAILVLRDVPPGGESGKHTQSGNEIVYILEERQASVRDDSLATYPTRGWT